MPSLSQKYLSWLLGSGRYPVLICLLAVTLVLSIFAVRVPIEQDTRSMSASQPQQTADYDRFLDLFGNDEDLLLSVTPPQLLSSSGLKLLAEVTQQTCRDRGRQAGPESEQCPPTGQRQIWCGRKIAAAAAGRARFHPYCAGGPQRQPRI